MTTLSVWKFDTATGADDAVDTLEGLQKQQLITIHDGATVSWAEGARKPRTRQLNSPTGAGALGGAFWGLLFGIIFFVPLLGALMGAASGALGGALTDVGIDDDFINRARKDIEPGTSALFVLSSDAVVDKVKEAFAAHQATLLFTNLAGDQEKALREVFAD